LEDSSSCPARLCKSFTALEPEVANANATAVDLPDRINIVIAWPRDSNASDVGTINSCPLSPRFTIASNWSGVMIRPWVFQVNASSVPVVAGSAPGGLQPTWDFCAWIALTNITVSNLVSSLSGSSQIRMLTRVHRDVPLPTRQRRESTVAHLRQA